MSNLENKYQGSFFTFDYKRLERELVEKAAKGWRLDRIGAFSWKFKKAEPENLKFFISYDDERLDGWTKEAEWKKMRIFSAEENIEPLGIAEIDRIESATMYMKKNFIPSFTIAFLGFLAIAFLNGIKYFGESASYDNSVGWLCIIATYVAGIFGFELLSCFFWEKASKKNAVEGKSSISMVWANRILNFALLGFLFLGVFYFIYS